MGSESTVGEVARFKNSLRKPVTASKREPGPYPYYGAAAIQDWVSDFLFEGLHLLVGEDGTVQTPEGRPLVQLVDGKFWVNNHAHVLVCDSDSDTRFLAYTLSEVQVAPYVTGAAQPKLNMGNLKRIPIRWPREERRREIAEIGKALDDRIENLRQTSATLEAITQALFKSWFVDFDPVRAKAEGREPEGMDATTAALFPNEFEDSELGPIPKGWRVGRLEDLLVFQRGFDLPAKQRSGDDYPVIAASGPSGAHSKAMVKGPGVVTGRSGVLGKVFIELGDFWPLNTTLWVREFKAASPCFAYELLRRLDLQQFNAGSAVPTLNRNHVHGLLQVVPPPGCVNASEEIAAPIRRCIRNNFEQSQSLANLRDTLLPRLISGELRLPEVEAAVEDLSA